MSDTFDPYLEWLSIKDRQRPPDHYALLGLQLYDGDQERIANAAMQRMAVVLEHDPGPHGQDARRIFDELEAARNCLADPQKKHAYDTRLRLQHAGGHKKRAVEIVAVGADGSSVLQSDSSGSSESFRVSSSLSDSSISRRARESKESTARSPAHRLAPSRQPIGARQLGLLGGVVGILLLVMLAGYYLFREPPEYDPVPKLTGQLQHSDRQQRLAAARELKKLGPQASGAIPLLVQKLGEEQDDNVRLAVAEALQNAGPNALSYGPQLQELKQRETIAVIRQILGELSGQ